VSTRTGPAAGVGGPGVISSSGLIQGRDGGVLSTHGGGGSWTVASAAKLIFGRARSLSTPTQLSSTTSAPASLRAPSPSPLSRQNQREDGSISPTGSELSIPMDINLPAARLYPSAPNSSAPSLVLTSPQSSRRNSIDGPANVSSSIPLTGAVKTLCNRGTAIISVHLAEPVLYLTGFEASEYADRSPAMLRGSLIVKLLKPSKIKTITLVFKGRARTEWPEGIPPKKTEFFEEKELMTHTWPFFNAQFTTSEISHGADVARIIEGQRLSMDLSRTSMDSVSSLALSDNGSIRSTPVGSPNLSASTGNGLFGIPFGQSRSFSKDDKTSTQTRGYRMFSAGEYMYAYL
jgi:arrestin-related trafficking adapter 3/6